MSTVTVIISGTQNTSLVIVYLMQDKFHQAYELKI